MISACTERSEYFNFCRPCIMITQRAKRDKSKGFGKRYDKPRLPAQRVLDEHVTGEARATLIAAKIKSTNGIEPYHFILRRRSRILRRQRESRPGWPDQEPTAEAEVAACK